MTSPCAPHRLMALQKSSIIFFHPSASLQVRVSSTPALQQPSSYHNVAFRRCFRTSRNEALSGVRKLTGVNNGGWVQNFINGRFVDSAASTASDKVFDPATGQHLALTPDCPSQEVDAAVDAATTAFETWKKLPVLKRVHYVQALQTKIKANAEEMAQLITKENGKTIQDARGDVSRGIDAVEHALSAPVFLLGRTLPGAATEIDIVSTKVPLGVCAGITPFNFPAMIPLWMFPLAIALGNTFVLKPSPRVPLTSMMLARLCNEVELPPGVFNVVHGSHGTVSRICEHSDIPAVSFVGGNKAGGKIYEMCAKNGKRVQCNMGAKNHAVIMPDASRTAAASAIVGAAFGAAGQRCMAVSVAVLVGTARAFTADILQAAKNLKVGPGSDSESDVGPMITPEARKKAADIIAKAVEKREVELLLDGTSKGTLGENYMSPTVMRACTTDTAVYREELFAPALLIVEVPTIWDAIDLINSNAYGNGAAIFTSSGDAAHAFQSSVDVGQIGINLPIPVSPPPFSFTGWRDSFAGDINMCGESGANFYLKQRTVLSRWVKLKQEETSRGKTTSFPLSR